MPFVHISSTVFHHVGLSRLPFVSTPTESLRRTFPEPNPPEPQSVSPAPLLQSEAASLQTPDGFLAIQLLSKKLSALRFDVKELFLLQCWSEITICLSGVADLSVFSFAQDWLTNAELYHIYANKQSAGGLELSVDFAD